MQKYSLRDTNYNVTAQSQCLRTWLMSLVYKGLSVSCFNRQLQLWVTIHSPSGERSPQLLAGTDAQGHQQGGRGSLPLGEKRNVLGIETSLQLKTTAVWKGCHLWHNHMNICGLRHFAPVWKEILVSSKGLPHSPRFVNTWVAFSGSETEIRLWTKHTQLAITGKHNRAHTHRGGLCVRKWEGFTSRVKTKQGWGLSPADCFLKCKGANIQEFANVREMSPHLNRFLFPSPLSIPATGLPLNVFTFSSFDCGGIALFYFTRESWIPGLSSCQAELSTPSTGPEKFVTVTVKSW